MADGGEQLEIPGFLRRDLATDPAHLRRLERERQQREPRPAAPPAPQRRQVPRRVLKAKD